MVKAKQLLAGVMSAAMVLTSAGITTLSSTAAVYAADSYHVISPASIPDYTWDGQVPDLMECDELETITVSGGLMLTRGVDFTVTALTSNVGNQLAVFTCIGNYEGSTIDPMYFNIVEPPTTNTYEVDFDPTGFMYDGNALSVWDIAESEPQVIMNGNTELFFPVNYDITVEPVDPAKAEGNVGEKYTVTFSVGTEVIHDPYEVTIEKRDLATVYDINAVQAEPIVYDGNAKTVTFETIEVTIDSFEGAPTVELDKYSIPDNGYLNNINATSLMDPALATITADADNAYFTGSTTVEFQIDQAVIGEGTALAATRVVESVYTGGEQNPDVEVKAYFDAAKTKEIPEKDYNFVYPLESIEVGTYKVSIAPSETENLVFGSDVPGVDAYKITPAALSAVSVEQIDPVLVKQDITGDFDDYFELKYGEYDILEENVDFAVTNIDPLPAAQKAGDEVKVTLTAVQDGNYTGTLDVTYTAVPPTLEEIYYSKDYTSQEYSGSAYKPKAEALGTLYSAFPDEEDPTIVKVLSPDEYEVTGYGENINAGNGSVTIEGKGDYYGQSAKVYFEITPQWVEGENIVVSNIASGEYYIGQEIKGAKVKVDGKEYAADDYTVTVAAFSDVEAKMTAVNVEFKGNYAGGFDYVPVDVEADPLSLDDAEVDGEIYAGMKDYEAWRIVDYIEVTLNDDIVDPENYVVSVDGTGKKDSTFTVTVEGVPGGSLTGRTEKQFTVTARDIDDISEFIGLDGEAMEDYEYDGTPHDIVLNLSAFEDEDVDPKMIVEGTDFEISYDDNINAGIVTATLTGKGNYTGTTEKRFFIDKHQITWGDFEFAPIDASLRQYTASLPVDLSDSELLKWQPEDEESKLVIEKDKDYEIQMSPISSTVAGIPAGGHVLYEIHIKEDSRNYYEYTFPGPYMIDSYEIVPKTVTDKDVTITPTVSEIPFVSEDPEDYDLPWGSLIVEVDGTELEEFIDYTYELTTKEESVKVGSELTVSVTFYGNYAGKNQTAKVTVVSQEVDLRNVKLVIPSAAELAYRAGTPKVIVANDIGKEKVGDVFEVVYYQDGEKLDGAPTDVGTYTACVEAKEGFVGTNGESAEFTITPMRLSKAVFDTLTALLTAEPVVYAAEDTEAPVLGPELLGEQFEVFYYDKEWDGIEETGEAYVTLKEGGNIAYDGFATVEFVWEKGELSEDKAAAMFAIDDGNQVYTGEPLEPVPFAVDPDAEDDWISVAFYENNINVAKKTAKAYVIIDIPEQAKYKACTFSGYMVFEIKAADITEQDIEVSDGTYTGEQIKPTVTITDTQGCVLDEGKDYKLTYGPNVDAGEGTVTITGIKNYTGECEETFTIKKATPTVTVTSKSYVYNGKRINYDGGKVIGNTTGALTYRFYTDAECENRIAPGKVKYAGTYYVKGLVLKDANNNAALSAKAAKIVIKKAENPLAIDDASRNASAKKLATQDVTILGVKPVSSGRGTCTFKKVKVSSKSSSFTVDPSNGRITIAKGTPKGTYKVTIAEKAAGTANYNASKWLSKVVTVTIK
jgi:hypothetical protein